MCITRRDCRPHRLCRPGLLERLLLVCHLCVRALCDARGRMKRTQFVRMLVSLSLSLEHGGGMTVRRRLCLAGI